MRRTVLRLLPAVALLVLCGCARFPSDAAQNQGRRLIVTFRVAGAANPVYGNYFFLINTEPIDTGQPFNAPIPVVTPPWGNGIAAGRYNYFVVWRADLQDYRLYRVDPNNLQSFQDIGRPVSSTRPGTPQGGGTFRFEILLSQIPPRVPPGQTAPPPVTTVRFNFLSTDRWGVGLSDQDTKRWDALGDARIGQINRPINLDIQQDRIVNNTDRNPDPLSAEPENDVTRSGAGVFETITVPDLDIVDWQVEIRS